MSESREKLLAALVSARAALDTALLELTEVPQAEPEVALPGAPCEHKDRTEIRTFGSTEHWVCKDCGYEYRR